MIPWSFVWNNILLRRSRTLLTILSIAGAVAAVVAVLQATSATRRQLSSLQEVLASRVAMEIVSPDGKEFAGDQLPTEAALPGVRALIPVFHVFATVSANERQIRGIGTGVDISQYQLIREFEVVSGRTYAEPGEVCLEAGAAERLGVAVGDRIRLRSREVPLASTRTVVGILEFRGVGTLDEKGSVFMSLTEAGRLKRAAGRMTSVSVVLDDDVDAAAMVDRVRSRLPADLTVNSVASSAELSRPTEMLVNVSLNVAATLSVVAALFIVVNSFQISVKERQRQFALLRLVGATADQVRRTMYREAWLLGLVGTVAGTGLGIVGGSALAEGLHDLFAVSLPAVPLRAGPVLAGLVFGPLVTLISVWYPARVACRAAPLSLLRQSTELHGELRLGRILRAGAGALLASGLLFAAAASGVAALWTSVLAITMLQIAALLLLPLLLRPGTWALYRLFGRALPVESLLGRRQILDNPGRSTLTVAVLFIVSASSTSIGNTILSVTGDIQSWLDTTVTADFLLRASRPRIDMAESEAVPDECDARLQQLPGIAAIDRVTFALVAVNGQSATLGGRQFENYTDLPLDLHAGTAADVRRGLLAGDVVLGTVLAKKLGVTAGQQVQVRASGIEQTLHVAGIAQEYTAGGLMIIMHRESAQKVFPISETHVFMIRCRDGQTQQVEAALRTLAREEGLIFQSLADLRGLVQGMVVGVTNRLWLILVLALTIAGFAIVNTLTMNVIEQTRCLGMLRVVGMTRQQVFRLFVLQAFVLGLLALVPGGGIGAVMSYLTAVTFGGVSDHDVRFQLDERLLGGYLACGLVLSLLAATLPALRAGRLQPLEAIHED